MRGLSKNILTAVMTVGVFIGTPAAGGPLEGEEHPLELSPEMAAFLDERIPYANQPMERLRRLLDLVFNNHELGFKYATVTHTAIQTFETRTGNCLSFTNMFIAMARHLGLDVKFREADTVPVWGQRGTVFTVSQHINVAVDMGSRWYLVDLYPDLGELEIGGEVISDERGLAHFYNNRAVDRLGAGDMEGALEYLNQALELAPKAPFLWTNLGVMRSRQGDLEGAVEALQTALDLRSNHLPAVSNLAGVFEKLGKSKQAERYRRKTQRFRERNPYYHYHLGLQAWADGSLKEALKHHKKAVKLKREEHRFHFALAQVFTRLGKQNKALHHLEEASRYAPDESGRLRYYQKQRLLLAKK